MRVAVLELQQRLVSRPRPSPPLPRRTFLRIALEASVGLRHPVSSSSPAPAFLHAPSRLQVDRLDKLRDPLVVVLLVLGQAQRVDPSGNGGVRLLVL